MLYNKQNTAINSDNSHVRTDANEHNHLVNTRRRKEGHIYSAWSLIIFISAEEVPAFLQFLH